MEPADRGQQDPVPGRPITILVLTGIVILLTVYSLQHDIQTVFTHIYYVPIILAAYWYQKKGVIYSAVLGGFYLASVILITGYNPTSVLTAAARVVVFVIIAAMVMILSLRIACQKNKTEESERKFRSIWEHIQAGVILVDAGTHEIIAANPEAERLTGFSEGEMIGHICNKFICTADEGKCPISDLHQTVDRSERILLNRNSEEIPVLKTVTETAIGGRKILIENFVAFPRQERP